jgi:RNA polymerase sigma factor (sigma-70 family)
MLTLINGRKEFSMEPADETLVLACRRGDAVAWETLVTRYQRLIYTIPRRAGLDENLSAEVFQRVFARLVEKLDSLEQPARVRAWLVTTARRETWRLVNRERAFHPTTSDAPEPDDELDTLPSRDPLPDETMVRLEEQHLVRVAVSHLDDRCRTLLTLLFYSAAPPPYAEVADELGTSEGSIGPTRARCLQKLRRLLAQAGF